MRVPGASRTPRRSATLAAGAFHSCAHWPTGPRSTRLRTALECAWNGTTSPRHRTQWADCSLRQLDHLDEKLVDLPDGAHELIQVDRLGDVGVGVQLVALEDVLLG